MSDNDQASNTEAQIAQLREQVDALVAFATKTGIGSSTGLASLHFQPYQPGDPSTEEAEASAILDRVERKLVSVEEQTNRLMRQYGL